MKCLRFSIKYWKTAEIHSGGSVYFSQFSPKSQIKLQEFVCRISILKTDYDSRGFLLLGNDGNRNSIGLLENLQYLILFFNISKHEICMPTYPSRESKQIIPTDLSGFSV